MLPLAPTGPPAPLVRSRRRATHLVSISSRLSSASNCPLQSSKGRPLHRGGLFFCPKWMHPRNLLPMLPISHFGTNFIPPTQGISVIPISIEAKARQKGQQDGSTRLGLAAVGRYTGNVIQDTIGPLEILNNLIYLARHSDDPQKTRAYLEEAEVHVRTVGDINLDLLRFYVKNASDADA